MTGPREFLGRISEAVETLTPGYFALVMAGGILSVGLGLEGFEVLSGALLALSAAACVVIVVLNAVRLAAFRSAVRADFLDPGRAFGFFTFVAGTNILGVRLAVAGAPWAAVFLLAVAGPAWLVLGYVIPWTAALGRRERPVGREANGTWFIWCVASQSVAAACATLEPLAGQWRTGLAGLAIGAWSVGVMGYAAVGALVAQRLLAYPIRPEDLRPQYFVSMGAMAIGVLAGSRIVEMTDAPMAEAVRGLVAGASVVQWAFASCLLPALLAAGVWRHLVRRVPLAYEPGLWSLVFPLGMYAVAGIYLGRADGLPVMQAIGQAGLWVALAAFAATFARMALHLRATLARRESPGGRDRAPDRA
jgi:tellurite resistance protein TehA-like permease